MAQSSQSKLDPELIENLKDPYWRLNNLYWIIDEHSNKVKFKMRFAQEKFWNEMWFWNQLLKSRQHGFSTEIDLIGLDLCLWNNNIEAGIIAHRLTDAQHIFETKIKYPYLHLPKAILDRIPATKCDAGTLRLANNSCIRVGTSMRSATLHFLHVSEHGKICAKFPQKAEELKTGTMPALHEGSYYFNESTAEGGAGDFYDGCMQAMADTTREKAENIKLNKMQCRFHFFAWHDDPKNATEPVGIRVSDELRAYFKMLKTDHGIETTLKQQAWYALKRDGAQGLGFLMKREHPSFPAEAFEQSVEGAIFGVELSKAMGEGRVGFLPYDETQPVYTFWDLGIGHPTCILFIQFIGSAVRCIDYHEEANRGITYHCRIVRDKPYDYEMHYPPHDSAKRDSVTGTPLLDTMEELLGVGKVERVERTKSKADSIQAGKQIFPYMFFEKSKCARLLKCLGFYRFEWDGDKSKYNDKPVDDWSADGADAFQGLGMVWLENTIGGKRLGSTTPIAGTLETTMSQHSSYDNNVMSRGFRSVG